MKGLLQPPIAQMSVEEYLNEAKDFLVSQYLLPEQVLLSVKGLAGGRVCTQRHFLRTAYPKATSCGNRRTQATVCAKSYRHQ